MKRENHITAELKEMGSPLAEWSRHTPYQVPDGYFKTLEADLQKLATSDFTNNADPALNLSKTHALQVPEGYFDQLPESILAIAKLNDQTARLPKNLPYHTPAGYFENLPAAALKAAKTTAVKKQRNLGLNTTSYRWPRQLAAAAVILLTIGLGFLEFFATPSHSATESLLTTVPDSVIQDYLSRSCRLDVDQIVSNAGVSSMPVDNSEIIQYLNESGWD